MKTFILAGIVVVVFAAILGIANQADRDRAVGLAAQAPAMEQKARLITVIDDPNYRHPIKVYGFARGVGTICYVAIGPSNVAVACT